MPNDSATRCPMCRLAHTRLGSVRPLRALRAATARFGRALRRVPRRLLTRRPARGERAVAEAVSHLAHAEYALAFRIRKIPTTPPSVPVATEQERRAAGGR